MQAMWGSGLKRPQYAGSTVVSGRMWRRLALRVSATEARSSLNGKTTGLHRQSCKSHKPGQVKMSMHGTAWRVGAQPRVTAAGHHFSEDAMLRLTV